MSRKKSRTPDAQAAQARSTASPDVNTADAGAVITPDVGDVGDVTADAAVGAAVNPAADGADDAAAGAAADAGASADAAATAADEPFAIDDVATLLVQLEVADTAELERVRSALMRLARETDDLDAAFALGGAATQIAAAAAGEDQASRSASLARANRLLEDAMVRLDAQAAAGSAAAPAGAPAALAERSPADAAGGLLVGAEQIDDADLMAAMAEDPAWADVVEELAAEELVAQAVARRDSGNWSADEQAAAPAPAAPATGAGVPSIQLPDDIDMDLLRDFIAESRDWIDGAEAALLALEHDPDDEESINTVFRAFHTIKGTAGFMGLSGISNFAHHAESLLSRVRDREIAFEGGCADLSLRATDMLATMLKSVEDALNGDPLKVPEEHDALMWALIALEQGDVAGAQAALSGGGAAAGNVAAAGDTVVAASAASVGPPPEMHDAAGPAAVQHRNDPPAITAAPSAASEAAGDPRAGDVPVERRQGDRRQGDRRQGDRRQDAAAADRSVRVRTDRLDRLIDMVGELVIAQSMISQDPSLQRGRDQALSAKVTHAGKLVRDLQDLTMSMRMVPLKPTVQKLARLVRDLAHKAGKQVEFVTEGEDTEIDRNMVDIVGDPLVHMVRNAIDHGLETPAERLAAGKSATGTLRLRAYHAGANVCVDLEDDGRGLNRAKILAKARDRGLVSNDKHLSDSEVFELIFAPGFSTADQVTDLSGRGVGMDVVKRNVESLRGRIDIASEAGLGSNFSIRLPLTLAITDGMLVRVGRERYIVPTTAIHMSFRPERAALSTINGRGEVVLLRDELMPIVRVHRLFDVDGAVADPADGILMIVGDQEKRTALLVDELLGQHQLVVKSLGGNLGAIPGISGAAILGDGRVGLILDVVGLVAAARTRGTDGGDPVRSAA